MQLLRRLQELRLTHRHVIAALMMGTLSLGCAATRQHLSLNDARMSAGQQPVENTEPIAPAPDARSRSKSQIGAASFYHASFQGRRTASGSRYDARALTAAHRTLEFGTRVRVTNLSNAKSIVVTVTDRGPYVRGRIIDLSRRAARALGFVQDGIARVRVTPLT